MGVTTPQEEHNAVTYTLTAAPEQHAQASRGLHVTSAESQSGTNAELQQSPSTWRARRANCRAIFCKVVCSPSGWQQIVLCVLWWLFILALIITIFVILLPRALAAPIQSFINTLKRNLTVPQLKAVIVAAVALLPCTLFIPFFPFIWVAGMAFDFGPAFALVMSGCIIGMSIQFWAARYLFKDKAERYLLKRRKDGLTVALRAVEMAGPWKVVALVRLAPSPYAVMNYAFGVCPTIKYHQYIITSVLCTAHHRALSVFFGKAMPTLADLFSGKPVKDVGAVVYRMVVLVLGIVLCIAIVIWAKRALKKLQEQELERERAEQAAADAAAAAEEGNAGLTPPDAAAAQTGQVDGAGSAASKAAAAAAAAMAVSAHKLDGAGQDVTRLGPSASTGDLVVVVDDAGTTSGCNSTLSLHTTSNSSSDNGSAPTAAALQLQQPAVAVAAPVGAEGDAESRASFTSRLSSVSSLRGLLSSRFQRSS